MSSWWFFLVLWNSSFRLGDGAQLHLRVTPMQLMERCSRNGLQRLLSLTTLPEPENLSSLLALLSYPSFAFTRHYRPSLDSLQRIFDFIITEHEPVRAARSSPKHHNGHTDYARLLFPLETLQESVPGRKFLRKKLLAYFPSYPLATSGWDPFLWPKLERTNLLTHIRHQQREQMESGDYCLMMLHQDDLSALAEEETSVLFDLECIREVAVLETTTLTYWISRILRSKDRLTDVLTWRLGVIQWVLNSQLSLNVQQQLLVSQALAESPLRDLHQQTYKFLLSPSQTDRPRHEALDALLRRFERSADMNRERIVVQFELLTIALQVFKDRTRLMSPIGSLLRRYGPDQVPPYVSRALFEQLQGDELHRLVLPWAWEMVRRSQGSPTTGHFNLGHLPRAAQLHWWQRSVLYLSSTCLPTVGPVEEDRDEWPSEEDDLTVSYSSNPFRIPTNAPSESDKGRQGKGDVAPILWSTSRIVQSKAIVAKHMPVRLYPDGPLRLACFLEYKQDILDWFRGRLVALALHGERLPWLPRTLAAHLLGMTRWVYGEEICWFYNTETVQGFLLSLLTELNELFLTVPPALIAEAIFTTQA